jgi:spermidine synthase
MGAVIDRLRMPRQPLTAVHLGGGALTIPRYIEATRPGSRQQVIELEPALWDLVRQELPLPRGGSLRVRIGDAREGLDRLPAGLVGNVDLLVSDVYSGAQTPAHLTTVEFYRSAARFLAPDGVMMVNVADGAGLAFARRQIATVRAVLEHVIVLAEVQTLKGRRFGNLVIAASASPLPTEWLPRLMAAGPHPAKVAQGAELEELARGARVVTDADATPSPKPASSLFER